jgi:hypothetical protein
LRIAYFLPEAVGFISLELSESLSESEPEELEDSSELDSCAFESFFMFFSCLVVGSGEVDLLELLSLSDAMAAVQGIEQSEDR